MTAVKTKTPAKSVEEAVAVTQETIETVVKAGTEAASKGYEQAAAMTKDQVEAAAKMGSAAFKGYEDVVQFNKENVDALLKSGSIMARGVQDVSKTLFGMARGAIDDGMAASKALAGAKSLTDLVNLQSGLMKTGFDKMISEGTKMSELGARVTEEALAPINGRVSAAMQKLRKTAA
ncbi:MAG: phasin family protein [Alphaproteobacteria bacterium]|nr:phasin family protein [Alphaproteobacteria bacterium]